MFHRRIMPGVRLALPGAIFWLLVGMQGPARINAPGGGQVPQDVVVSKAVELKLGQPIEGELKGGESHWYQIGLRAGQFLRVVVEQKGIDVVVSLRGPDEKTIVEMHSPNGAYGLERASLIAESSGVYGIEVRSGDKQAPPGRYEIKIAEARTSTAQDRSQIQAQTAFLQATQFLAQQTVDGRRKAVEAFGQAASLYGSAGSLYDEATALDSIGSVYHNLGENQKALDYCSQALALWRAVGDREGEATALNNIGMLYNGLGEKQKALDYYNEVLPLVRTVGDRDGEATTLNNIGRVYDDLGEKQKALDYYGQALPLWRAVGDREGEATALSNIGRVYDVMGEKQKAVDSFKQALPLAREVGYREGEAKILNNIGSVYSAWGEKQKALEYYNQVLPLVQTVGDRDGEAMALNNLGEVYDDLGEKQKALDHLNQALPLLQAVGNRGGEAVGLNNIGRVYNGLGEKQKALDYYNHALLLVRAVGDRDHEALTLNNIGGVYQALGQKQKALDYYNQALPFFRAVGDRDGEATVLNGIGMVYDDLGEKQKALDYYNHALLLVRAVGDRDHEALTLNNIGGVYQDLGQKQKALDYYNQALPFLRAVGDRDGEADTLGNKADVERGQGNLPEARASIEAAIKIIESLRTEVARQELRASYFSTVQGYYQGYVDILMRLHSQHPAEGYDRLALEASERGRARSLLETLAEAHADIRQGVDGQLLERDRALQQLLDAKSARFTRLMDGPHTAAQAETAQKEIDDVLGQYQDVEAKIRTASPHYAALTQPQPLSAKAIQQQVLDSDTLLLEYALGTEQSYLWAVTPDSLTAYRLPKRREIESLARELHAKLIQTPAVAADQIYELAMQLSKVALGPVASQLAGKRLVIVADGVLNYIPFGALPTPSDSNATGKQPLLAVDHEIGYLPSASVLDVLRQETQNRPPAPKLVAVMADPVFSRRDERLKPQMASPNGVTGSVRSSAAGEPQGQDLEVEIAHSQLARSAQDSGITRDGGMRRLRFSREEAHNIVKLVPNDSRLEDLDFAASKASATGPALRQYRMVHFATHGLLDSEHPELSGVVLSLVDEQGSLTDGFLRLHDIFNLNLPADLVVLSACQTGLGKEVRGEGLVGLTRGFMYAGAPRVVVSLWSVDDQATAELMGRFYQSMLKDGLRPAQALQAAQMSMGKGTRWSAPYYWAAFVLQGEWR